MSRLSHAVPGLVLAALLAVLALTGALLAADAGLEHTRGLASGRGASSVASVAERAAAGRTGVERIERKPSGIFVVNFQRGGELVAERFDPASGKALGSAAPSQFMHIVTRLHRSLLLDNAGRAIVGLSAFAMLVLAFTGVNLLAAKSGGWRRVLGRVRGGAHDRRHASIARLAFVGILLSGASGAYLSLVSFEIIPEPTVNEPDGATASIAGRRLPVGRVGALNEIDAAGLRELTFPRRDDPMDSYRISTAQGSGQIDAVSGAMIEFEPLSAARRIHETIYMLHTGQGMAPLALLLAISALGVPALAWTGGAIWWRRRKATPRIRSNAPAQAADTIIFVGSEGGTTWRFAAALHRSLRAQGFVVHATAMDRIARGYPRAKRVLILAATYGDGTPPASGRHFVARLVMMGNSVPIAVLGFGDRSFPRFCKFADDITRAASARGCPELLPITRIDRQSPQLFAAWVDALGRRLGVTLAIDPGELTPETIRLVLSERANYGEDVQAPTSILRFVRSPLSEPRGWRPPWARRAALPQFEAGDLVGIQPPGGHAPRFYSVASSSRQGMLEICVRKQPGGLCSTHLHELKPGDSVAMFVRPNPAFRLKGGRAPVIMVGAGAGIAPLVGLIGGNAKRRPIHLYWGGRHPASDFLYEGELSYFLSDRRLTRFRGAFSRIAGGLHVQERIAREASVVRDLISRGANVMVCGSRQMGEGVATTFDNIIRPLGLDVARLKAEGRYVEDVY